MRRRLTLRREAIAELSPSDLGVVQGANTGALCYPVTNLTRCEACQVLVDKVRDLTTAVAVTVACPETR